MNITVIDFEANGLLDTVDNVWCMVGINLETEEVTKITCEDACYRERIMSYMNSVELWVGHNIIGYDIPMLEKTIGYTYEGGVEDTWLMSQMSGPDRKKHPGLVGKKNGPHSLANFGCIFGQPKPEHDEWDKYSEEMLHRCTEDTWINLKAYKYLLKEMAA